MVIGEHIPSDRMAAGTQPPDPRAEFLGRFRVPFEVTRLSAPQVHHSHKPIQEQCAFPGLKTNELEGPLRNSNSKREAASEHVSTGRETTAKLLCVGENFRAADRERVLLLCAGVLLPR